MSPLGQLNVDCYEHLIIVSVCRTHTHTHERINITTLYQPGDILYPLFPFQTSKRRKKVNPNGSGGGSNGGGNGHGHGSSRGCGGLGPGSALWLRPIHNLLQHHQHQHCRLSNGGQHAISVATAEHVDGEGGVGGEEELEMKSLPVRSGSTNGNSCGDGRNSSAVTQGMGALLGRLNGGMNYPTILPSFVCSYSSKTPPPHSQQCKASPEQHPVNHPASEHTETLTKLYQLMGQHSKRAHTLGISKSPTL